MRCCTALLLVIGLWLPAQIALADNPSTLQVSGEGMVAAVPDRALFQVEVAQQAAEASAAQRHVEAVTETLVAAIRQLTIDPKSLAAASLTVTPQYRWTADRSERLLDGYRVSRRISFTLTTLEQLGLAYQTLIDNGATSVDPAYLSSSQEQALSDEALALAYADAHRQAQVLAQAASATLGAPLEISSVPGGTQPRPVMRMAAAMESADGVYEPGQLKLSRQVSVRFSLQP